MHIAVRDFAVVDNIRVRLSVDLFTPTLHSFLKYDQCFHLITRVDCCLYNKYHEDNYYYFVL